MWAGFASVPAFILCRVLFLGPYWRCDELEKRIADLERKVRDS